MKRTQGGYYFSGYTVRFDKPHRTLQQQLSLLQHRGLIVQNLEVAERYLGHLNYYRLSAYWIPFLENRQTNRFKKGTKFEDVLNLYIFDRELRLLVLDAIERIEVSIRSKWAYYLSQQHGAHAHLNGALFKSTKKWKHETAVN